MKTIVLAIKYACYLLLGLLALLLLSIPISIFEIPGDLLGVDNSPPLALDNVNVVDVKTGQVLENRQILIADGLIESIEIAGTRSGPEFERIDLEGAYVVPGLFDMHVHIHDRKYLAVNLAYGVTSVRNMRGLPMHLRWKTELEQGRWLGSNLYTSSPVLDGEKYAHALQQVVTSPAEARRLVKKYRDAGYDLIKAYGYLDKAVFEAIVDEARVWEIPVAKHGPNPVPGATLESNRGLQSLEHVEDIFQGPLNYEFDRERLGGWITNLKAIDPVVTPTLATFDHLTLLSEQKDAFIADLPLETLNPLYRTINREFEVSRWLAAGEEQIQWNKAEAAHLLEIVRELDMQGIKLLVGSDAGTLYMPPGPSTHREMALMTQAGLSAITVLQAATINAAETLGKGSQYGSVEVGKIADLVVVAENPLDDLQALRQPQAVIKAGQWISATELARLRESGKNPSNFYISLGRLLEDLLVRAFS
ncbi:MAG: amidohydrolase family protein [Pseudomonadales bacterium]|nr:amidohydrolase family protein [Pseudomonadales bacterium]